MNCVCASTYFLAAVAKLKGPLGRRWASGEPLRAQVAVDGLRKELLGAGCQPDELPALRPDPAVRTPGGRLARPRGDRPTTLADRRAGQMWALNAFAMHWGIFDLMGSGSAIR